MLVYKKENIQYIKKQYIYIILYKYYIFKYHCTAINVYYIYKIYNTLIEVQC